MRRVTAEDVDARTKEVLGLVDQLDRADAEVENAERERDRETDRNGQSGRSKSLQAHPRLPLAPRWRQQKPT